MTPLQSESKKNHSHSMKSSTNEELSQSRVFTEQKVKFLESLTLGGTKTGPRNWDLESAEGKMISNQIPEKRLLIRVIESYWILEESIVAKLTKHNWSHHFKSTRYRQA